MRPTISYDKLLSTVKHHLLCEKKPVAITLDLLSTAFGPKRLDGIEIALNGLLTGKTEEQLSQRTEREVVAEAEKLCSDNGFYGIYRPFERTYYFMGVAPTNP